MRIGILQADSVLKQFQSAHGNYPGMIADVLGRGAAELGIEISFETFDVEHGEYPADIAECEGYVITGSRMSVYDDEPWIHDLTDYVRELHAAAARVIGICFGHQLIAHALGGRTESAAVGWGVGIHTSQIVDSAWFMDADTDAYSVLVSHKDQVSQLPADATLLATSEFCPNSMFCLGSNMLALQGHPEFDRPYSLDLMNMREQILGKDTYQAGVASLEKTLDRDQVARWIVRFLQG